MSAVFISNRGGDALAAAVGSVLEQGHRPLELVIFGNGRAVPPPLDPGEDVDVRLGESSTDLGVAGGRNAAAALATGEVLLFLDDDAILRPGSIAAALEVLDASPDVGAVACRIVDPDSHETALWYYPEERDTHGERPFDASTILGGASFVRHACFDRLGGLWDGYQREMEEIDFSWRLIDAGWTIRYEPAAVVEHSERTGRRLYRYAVPSILWMLWRLLPPGLALRQTLVKLPLFAVRAVRHGELKDFLAGLVAAARGAGRVASERSPLRPETVRYLREINSRSSFGKRLQWSLRRAPETAP